MGAKHDEGSLLLVPEHPLQVLPALATEIGLKEAIVVQQLHYWTSKKQPDDDDQVWIHNTMEEWLEQFPFFTQRTIERTWTSIKKQDLVEVRQRGGSDRTNHYRLKYESLPRYKFPCRQNGGMKPPKGRDGSRQIGGMSNNNPETSTENPPLPPEGESPVKKVNRKPVTAEEYAQARAIVAAFNRIAGTRFDPDTYLIPVIGRIRKHPELTAAQHGQIIATAFDDPWWKSRPNPRVVYGNAEQFEACLEEWRSKGSTGGRRRSRQRPDQPIVESEAATAAWAAVKERFRADLSASTVRIWIDPLEVAGERDGTLVLLDTTDTGGIRTWVERRYLSFIRDALKIEGSAFADVEIIGHTDLDLQDLEGGQ